MAGLALFPIACALLSSPWLLDDVYSLFFFVFFFFRTIALPPPPHEDFSSDWEAGSDYPK